ncbi:MAG TPA: phosphoenolpyruvate mutase [Clostridia bacterium]|nr:phosphoenolpyruvate mutase [Clostridia bacterium]
MKTVYLAMSADIIHNGHINIIKKASELGEVIVGVLEDRAIASYKRVPLLSYKDRKFIVENIKGVEKVIPQRTLDYEENLLLLRPDYVVHGDDWRTGPQSHIRAKVVKLLEQWKGQLIEFEYTRGVSISKLDKAIMEIGTTPQIRLGRLRKLLEIKPILRILEAHNGLTGIIVEKTRIERDEEIKEFDGIWISSLCDSTAKGKPDIEVVDFTSRLNTINNVLEVTTKPIILDGDTGGKVEHFVYTVRSLERLGVSAIIIEDKIGLKKCSLFGTDVVQQQDTIEDFSRKISEGKKAQVTEDFMIIARTESLILKKGIDDAITRVKAYIEAGADGIMIHSKERDPSEIFEFCELYKELDTRVPLVVVPTSYSQVTESELRDKGINIVIYANHLLRSAFPAMKKTAKTILENERALEVEENCLSIKEILTLIPGGQ